MLSSNKEMINSVEDSQAIRKNDPKNKCNIF